MSVENTPQGLTIEQALTQLEATRNPTPQEEQLEDEQEEVVDNASEEEVIDEEESEEVEEGDDQEATDEEDTEEDSADEEVFEIEVDGETVEVTGEELTKGYLRHNDYTRKRQADAKQARELEATYQAKLAELDQALTLNVSAEQQRMNAIQQQYNQSTDEAERQNLHYQYLQLQQAVQARGTQQSQLQQQMALQKQAQAEAYHNQQLSILSEMYDDWDTRSVQLKGYLEGVGFSDLSPFVDAKMAELVDKARQFDDLQQKRETVVKKKLKRKVPQTVQAGQGEKKFNVNRSHIDQAAAEFNESPTLNQALALLKAKRGNSNG